METPLLRFYRWLGEELDCLDWREKRKELAYLIYQRPDLDDLARLARINATAIDDGNIIDARRRLTIRTAFFTREKEEQAAAAARTRAFFVNNSLFGAF